jgi:hypothetical protein
MLNKETSDKLAVLGFDVSKLTEAIKAETEVSLDVPKLYTETDYTKFGTNRFNEGKTAMGEILSKELNDKYALGLEEKDRKDFHKVIEKMTEKAVKDAGIKPAEQVTALSEDIKKLKTLIDTQKSEYENKLKEIENQNFSIKLRSSLLSALSGEYLIGKDDIYDIFEKRHRVTKDESGRAVVLDEKGEIMKTDTRDPVTVDSVFKTFAESYVKKDGMGGGDTSKPGTPSKFSKFSEFEAYCKNNNLQANSPEAQKILFANKAENFNYQS